MIDMAYPAPTSVYVPAFDVTVGTTSNNPITFNIVGGTQIIRSNRVYIYDATDNSLICSHLQARTDGVHEFPAKTSGEIVYASGKSSADLVNGKQYYVKIQTYTTTNASASGESSAMSVAKLFWALATPTLAIASIPSTIDTTSYNIAATYTTNLSTSLEITNAIQQYEFILYDAGGNQVATSGMIIGSGTQIGTTNVYNLSYNFTGLENGTTYYVKLNASTLENMILSAQSNTFTVNVGGTTLNAATAVNNACGGYISVTSNLSSQYSSSITKVLVKRKDLESAANPWVTLFAIPISQASDMNFTVVDFYNAHGHTYTYAIVPVFIQTQSGVQVEVEGSYTQSDEVESFFNGVFVADNTGIQKFVAGANYGDSELHQATGVIETIGGRYPVIVSNSNMNYYTGSIGAYALGEGLYRTSQSFVLDYITTSQNGLLETASGDYFIAAIEPILGELNRNDIVKLRKHIGEFLINKSPKIIKDWNGNIFLVMFTENINFSFTNDWGMGLVTFEANWTEIGQPDDQDDLEDCGLINLGGV